MLCLTNKRKISYETIKIQHKTFLNFLESTRNTLHCYFPDDIHRIFLFNFNIKSIVAFQYV